MEKKIKIIIGSPIEYQELVAYIKINEEYIALVQKEEGNDKMKVEFFGDTISNEIYLDSFLEALKKAKDELSK